MGAFAKPGAAKDGKGQLPSQPTLGMVQFVMGLSVFSEKASLAEKAAFMFQMYDVRQQNSISKVCILLLCSLDIFLTRRVTVLGGSEVAG